MHFKRGWVAAALFGLAMAGANRAAAQETQQAPPVQGGRGGGRGRAGGFIPGQQRPAGDPEQIARGPKCRGPASELSKSSRQCTMPQFSAGGVYPCC